MARKRTTHVDLGWLWDSMKLQPESADERTKGIRWVLARLFRDHPPLIPAGETPMLDVRVVDEPSEITRRALRTLVPEVLLELLCVVPATGARRRALRDQVESSVDRQKRRLKSELKTAKAHLRTAEHALAVLRDPTQVRLMRVASDDARSRVERIEGRRGPEAPPGGGFSLVPFASAGLLQRVQRETKSMLERDHVRDRLRVLVGVLHASDPPFWTYERVWELILASGTDWRSVDGKPYSPGEFGSDAFENFDGVEWITNELRADERKVGRRRKRTKRNRRRDPELSPARRRA